MLTVAERHGLNGVGSVYDKVERLAAAVADSAVGHARNSVASEYLCTGGFHDYLGDRDRGSLGEPDAWHGM